MRAAERARRFPLGAGATQQELNSQPYELLARLRVAEPVSWVPAIGGWLVTRHDLVTAAMRNAASLTVDDPRFTTAAVLGASMLSLDGEAHERHRAPVVPPLRPRPLSRLEPWLVAESHRLVQRVVQRGGGELRGEVAGPLAVATITRVLGLSGTTAADMLGWYEAITRAITALTVGDHPEARDLQAAREVLARAEATIHSPDGRGLLQEIRRISDLSPAEIAADAAVMMFGAIETAEGMIANAFWHLLSTPGLWSLLQADRRTVAAAVEESARMEPAAAVVDRYAVAAVDMAGVTIPEGEKVTLSLLAANRDPAVFDVPDAFDLHRDNHRRHVTFARGPHACIGAHLARMETTAVLQAALDLAPTLQLDAAASSAPTGLVFRKAPSVIVRMA